MPFSDIQLNDGRKASTLYITSKYGLPHETPRKALEDSLSKVGIKYLDLYLIHAPRGDYVGAWTAFEKIREEERVLQKSYHRVPPDAPIGKAAERLGITPTQVIFLWVKAKGAVIVTFSGALVLLCVPVNSNVNHLFRTSSNKKHLEEYLAVGDLPPLTSEEIEEIDNAGAQGPPSIT
ncbi:hypothetical protein H1R20_g16048, partial [Candolleomyces eurysporus]